MTAPDPKTVREIARDCAADYLGDACDIAAHVIGHFGPGAPDDLDPWITAVRADLSAAVASWPDEQQPAEATVGEQGQDGAADAVQRFADAWRDTDARWSRKSSYLTADGVDGGTACMTEPQLRAVLTERDALAARVAELTAEREADTRVVAEVADAAGALPIPRYESMPELAEALNALYARFEERITKAGG